MGAICVVGSAVVDLVLRAPRRPQPGETVIGTGFETHVGGKGVNQAIAAARAGASVSFVGVVGDDDFGRRIESELVGAGVDIHHLRRVTDAPTGVGVPLVEPSGENSIVFVGGANDQLRPSDVRAAKDAIVAADIVLIQLELPQPAIDEVVAIAQGAAQRLILNPAPARLIPPSLLDGVDVLVPNEVEASQLVGTEVSAETDLAAALVEQFDLDAVIVTHGSRGVVVATSDGRIDVPAIRVEAIDTVGAGDAFCGNLAARLAVGADLEAAARYANAAASLAVTRSGAAPAMPTRDEVLAHLASSAVAGDDLAAHRGAPIAAGGEQ